MKKFFCLVFLMVMFVANIYAADAIVAKVGNASITEKEVNAILYEIIAKQGFDPRGVDSKDPKIAEVKNDIVKNLVQREVLYALASKNIPKDIDKKTNEMFAELKKKYKTPKEFEDAMKKNGTSEKEVKEKIRKNIILENYVNTISSSITVTEKEKKDFFNKNPDIFKDPEMVRASHIFIKIDDKTKDADAKAKIDAINKELKSGKSFEDLAKKYSQDGSAAKGGDLGFFPRGVMVKEFENVAFSLQPGKVSAPFKSQYGYHIVKVTEKRPVKVYTYAEVEKNIEGKLKMDKLRAMIDKKVADAMPHMKVQIVKKY